MLDVQLAAPPETRRASSSQLDGRQPLCRRDGRQHVARAWPTRWASVESRNGVVVIEIQPGCLRRCACLRAGDMVTAVNGQEVRASRTSEAHRQAACRAWASAAKDGNSTSSIR